MNNNIMKVAKFLVEVEYSGYRHKDFAFSNAQEILIQMFDLPKDIVLDKKYNLYYKDTLMIFIHTKVNNMFKEYFNNIINDVPYTKCLDCGSVIFNSKNLICDSCLYYN
ncbi:MAG: hypothetical protein RR406_05400 [Bacilli bacterium]